MEAQKMKKILARTKEQGSGSQYIEVGDFYVDEFDDEEWNRLGYAKNFEGIEVKRKWEGAGASTYCKWIIKVPEGFAHAIRITTNVKRGPREHEILFNPVEDEA